MRDKLDPFDVVQTFLCLACEVKAEKDIIVSIDPGASGAIGFLCGQYYRVIDIPVIKIDVDRHKKNTTKQRQETGNKTRTVKGSTTRFDYGGICAIFKLLKEVKHRIVVALEAVPTSLGPGKRHAEILLNRAYAMWPLFLYSRGYTVEEVRPNVWKQKLGLNGKKKEDSRLKALSLFPKADIARKKDHDRAEALLLAEYVRRMRN